MQKHASNIPTDEHTFKFHLKQMCEEYECRLTTREQQFLLHYNHPANDLARNLYHIADYLWNYFLGEPEDMSPGDMVTAYQLKYGV
jgi:hypothetical protein